MFLCFCFEKKVEENNGGGRKGFDARINTFCVRFEFQFQSQLVERERIIRLPFGGASNELGCCLRCSESALGGISFISTSRTHVCLSLMQANVCVCAPKASERVVDFALIALTVRAILPIFFANFDLI